MHARIYPMRLVLTASLIVGMTVASMAQNAAAPAAAPAMILTIPGYSDGSQIPVKFTQAAPGVPAGEGTSPAIQWANAPAGTQSFVLHMHDMDVTRNKTSDDQ